MTISIRKLHKGHIGYKMASYDTWCPYTNLTSADDSGQWAGLYVAPARETAEGYGTDYLDKTGKGTAYLHQVHLLTDVNLLVCDDKTLGGIDKTGEEKAALVRSQLPASIPISAGPLIPALGKLGYFFMGYHDDDNMELIVPNRLSALVVLMKNITLTYQGWSEKTRTVHPI